MAVTTTICKQFTLEAAHHLSNHDGKCRQRHGHTYKIELFVRGSVREAKVSAPHPKEGMVMDFGELGLIFKQRIFDVMDHQDLNDVLPIPVTTAEEIAKWIFHEMAPDVYRDGIEGECWLDLVRVWETKRSYAEYSP